MKIVPMFPGPGYRNAFMSECFDLVYHGQGGFSWFDVWNMPIPHRRFSIKKIKEYLDRVEQARNQQQQKVTEKTDIKNFKIPKEALEASKEMTYISKAKTKK